MGLGESSESVMHLGATEFRATKDAKGPDLPNEQGEYCTGFQYR